MKNNEHLQDYNHPNYTNRSGFNSQHKNITVKRKLETSRTENIETKGEERYRDTIETFLNSQNDFNGKPYLNTLDNYHNNYKLRFDRSGSPLKRSVLGSVEMFEKERVKRTTYFKQSGNLNCLSQLLLTILFIFQNNSQCF